MLFYAFEEFVEELKRISRSKKIYIWGAGLYGDLLGQFLDSKQIGWCGYYENHVTDEIKILNGKEVIAGTAADADPEKVYVLSMRNYGPVEEQLIAEGVSENDIFAFGAVDVFDKLEESIINHKEFSAQIKKFHHIHKGESCFVIGNGPSLTGEDLEEIHRNGMVSFACNYIYRAYDQVSWRPDYYFMIDAGAIVTIIDQLAYISENCKYMFSRSNGRLREYADQISNLRLFKSVFSASEEQVSFSSDCSEHLYIGHTVTYAMLQFAVYMGFKNIYLIGADCDFQPDKKLHFVEHDGSIDATLDTAAARNFAGYRMAKEFAEENHVSIYNATHGGKLEIFKRVDFDSLF